MVAPTTVMAMAEMRGIILLYDQFDTRAHPAEAGATRVEKVLLPELVWLNGGS